MPPFPISAFLPTRQQTHEWVSRTPVVVSTTNSHRFVNNDTRLCQGKKKNWNRPVGTMYLVDIEIFSQQPNHLVYAHLYNNLFTSSRCVRIQTRGGGRETTVSTRYLCNKNFFFPFEDSALLSFLSVAISRTHRRCNPKFVEGQRRQTDGRGERKKKKNAWARNFLLLQKKVSTRSLAGSTFGRG